MATLDSLAAAMTAMQLETAQQKHDLTAMHALMTGAVTTQTTDALAQELKAVIDKAEAQYNVGEQRWNYVQPSVTTLDAKTSALITRMDQLEHQASIFRVLAKMARKNGI